MASLTAPGIRYELDSIVSPGDRLATVRTARSGTGTYVKAGNIYASVAGRLQAKTDEQEGDHAETGKTTTHLLQVCPGKSIASLNLLTVGQVAIGRVTRITLTQAFIQILATTSVTGDAVRLAMPQEGIIRREDVRSGASEQVHIHESFLPGDLVICKVLALGDQRRYVLTTAEPELGVLFAESRVSGLQMTPSSWKEMSCSKTGAKELRKCARPRALTE